MATLPPLRLPSDFAQVAVAVGNLAQEAYERIVSLLDDPRPVVSRASLATEISVIEDLHTVSGGSLLDLLISLGGLRDEADVEDLREVAVAFVASPDLPEEIRRDLLEERLDGLLRTRSVDLLGRGLDLLAEHEHLLVGSRVLSDIRPLFSRRGPESIDGSVIGHVLRLSFARGAPASIDVSLDLEDLQELLATIQRAIAKEETLRGLVTETGSPLVVPFGASE